MFIQTEATPNPATLKFLPGRPVLENGTLDMRDRAEAANSPLAERLFDVSGVGGVFLTGVGALLLGVILMEIYRWIAPDFFTGRAVTPDPSVLIVDGEPLTDPGVLEPHEKE